jgi:hypothetical protein
MEKIDYNYYMAELKKGNGDKNIEQGASKAFITSEVSKIWGWYNDMPFDPNEVLGIRSSFKTKEEAIRKMDEGDPTLAGLKETLIASILGQEQEIKPHPEDKGEKEFIEFMFSRISSKRDKQKDMLTSLFIGNSFTELIYTQEMYENRAVWALDESLGGLIVRPPSSFCFKQKEDGTWDLLFTPYGDNIYIESCLIGNEVVLDRRKFKVMTYNAQFGNPIGRGIYNDIYNYWWLKKEEVKLWGLLGEVFVSPSKIITPKDKEAQFNPSENEELTKYSKNPRANSTIILPLTQVEVTFLNQNPKDPGDAYNNFINFCSLSMAYRMHGQGLALNETSGSQAKERVRLKLFNYLTESYIKSFEEFMNFQIIKQLCDLNFENPAYPKFSIVLPEAPDPKEWVEAMEKATGLGAEIPRTWFEEKLGVPNPKEKEDILKMPEKQGGQQFVKFLEEVEERVQIYMQDEKYLTE